MAKTTKDLLEFWEDQMKLSHMSSNYFFRKSPSHYHMMLLVMNAYKFKENLTVEEIKTRLFKTSRPKSALMINEACEKGFFFLEKASKLCGVSLSDIKLAAEMIGKAKGFLSLWAMGLNQSVVGVDKNTALYLEEGDNIEAGAGAAYRVDFAGEINEEWISGANTVGLTSGASVPEILVRDLLAWLSERGFGDVETVTAMQESLLFSLPPELRKDLKAAGKS